MKHPYERPDSSRSNPPQSNTDNAYSCELKHSSVQPSEQRQREFSKKEIRIQLERLPRVREYLCMNQEQFARALGYLSQDISDWLVDEEQLSSVSWSAIRSKYAIHKVTDETHNIGDLLDGIDK